MNLLVLFRTCAAVLIVLTPLMGAATTAHAEVPSDLPLLTIKDFEFDGAFRVSAKHFGDSNANIATGPIAWNPDNKSVFIVGHTQHQAIAEFAVPKLVKSESLADLNIADKPIQPFAKILNRTADGNPQNLNRINGLLYVRGPKGPELLVNALEYYDAPANNTLSMLVVRDASRLADSKVDGAFEVQGGPGHTAGWMSPIPEEWQKALGGEYITGCSSGIPIITRLSVGPTAFVFDPMDVAGKDKVDSPIRTIKLLDFSNDNRLHTDLSNETRKNDIWTHLAKAAYGIIIPGTRTYATFGYSGGHESGVGYKIVQDNGNRGAGHLSYKAADNYHCYWLWDVNDLLKVKAGKLAPHDVRPYEYGRYKTPFEGPRHRMGGGTYDPSTGRIFLLALDADNGQGEYANPPVIMTFKAKVPSK